MNNRKILNEKYARHILMIKETYLKKKTQGKSSAIFNSFSLVLG